MRNACHKPSPHSGCRAVGALGRQKHQAAQMRAPLCLLLLVAHAVDMLALHRRKKQGTGLGGNCTGCVICSEENGCSTCQQRLFLFIRREGIRQYGKCVHDCPLGFFGIRGQEANRCKKCGATCDSCFSQDFCIRCKRRFHLYKGKCLPTCPPGTLTHQSTRECQEECEPSPWGSWSPCIHNGKTCGSGWGLETRVREAGPAKQEETPSCQVLAESRKCPIKRPCPRERNPRQKSRKDRKDRGQRKDRKLERRPQQPGSQ